MLIIGNKNYYFARKMIFNILYMVKKITLIDLSTLISYLKNTIYTFCKKNKDIQHPSIEKRLKKTHFN